MPSPSDLLPASARDRRRADWGAVVESLEYAFQPIVNIHSGLCYGYEALLRGYERVGFQSIPELFDRAFADGVLFAVEAQLLERAIVAFTALPHKPRVKLFCNVDNRVVQMPDYQPAHALSLLAGHGIPPESFCLEISERHEVGPRVLEELMRAYRRQTIKLALDDFGKGFSGLRLLYESEPDFIKIDRFFVATIADDARKRVVLSSIVSLARHLGVAVIAEGVETEREFRVCRDVGCELVQGFAVAPPTDRPEDLSLNYGAASVFAMPEHRFPRVPNTIRAHVEAVPTVDARLPLAEVVARFGRDPSVTVLVVLGDGNEPLGLVRERDLKRFVYHPYGRDLLANPANPHLARDVMRRCPIVDVDSRLEHLVAAGALEEAEEGLIVVSNREYMGFLSSRALLAIMAEENIATARDQNPLTRLPGNARIYEYVSRAAADCDTSYVLVYFDFDWFKAFNDAYGFRQGDRAILLFADLLGKMLLSDRCFVGHIGGDDFFAGFRGELAETALERVRQVSERFVHEVESFYDAQTRAQGFLVAVDRDGRTRQFPLMTVSAAILALGAGRDYVSAEEITEWIARAKREAKRAPDRLCTLVV